jgi:DNA-binding response OmpR family regulator
VEELMFFKKSRLSDVRVAIPREELIRRSRVLVVDDERPDLIDDLKKAGLAVDYEADINQANLATVEKPTYDLILLDFANVGRSIGADQGLSLLKHVKRVNPGVVILTYTSKSLGTDHAEFFRAADGVLKKDAGIGESLEKIEEALRKSHSPDKLWASMLSVSGIEAGTKQDFDWQDAFVRGLGSEQKLERFKMKLSAFLTSPEAQKAGLAVLMKLLALYSGHRG